MLVAGMSAIVVVMSACLSVKERVVIENRAGKDFFCLPVALESYKLATVSAR